MATSLLCCSLCDTDSSYPLFPAVILESGYLNRWGEDNAGQHFVGTSATRCVWRDPVQWSTPDCLHEAQHGLRFARGFVVSCSIVSPFLVVPVSVPMDVAVLPMQDILFSNLTVRETLICTARLRLPGHLSFNEKLAAVSVECWAAVPPCPGVLRHL